MFKPVGTADFPASENETLEFWKQNDTFGKSLKAREGKDEFVFYDGPPFATGLPHYGHLLAGTIKDVVPRYQTMKGKHCTRTFGWDCHGLPVEYEMEKQLNLSGKREIEKYGIDKFNEACRSIVLRYTSEWKTIVTRMGRWVDFEHGYRTMDRNYMESIWWVFKQLWDKGLIYEGFRVQPYCPRCSTPLSNFEANQGYIEKEDPAVTLRFKVMGTENTYILAWTTTPWTLPSNMALAVGNDIDYVKVADDGAFYIMAEARLGAYYKKEMPEIVKRFKGSELVGLNYEPLFDYFSGPNAPGAYCVEGAEYVKVKGGFDFRAGGAYRVISADFVSTEDGTGIVHTAPLFGEADCEAGKANGLPAVCPVDEECRFTDEIPDYKGLFVKDADKEIMRRLKEEGKLVHRGTIRHNYPHCWRCDSPLIYKAIPTWFMNIEKVKAKMLAANAKMTWIPAHIKEGRFGKWLENARDWNLSRNRYWGCPIPIWRNAETGEKICVGSVEELEKLTGKKITDIHKHFVDDLEIVTANGTHLRRIPEVFDCWFESGSMPYAQNHYPFENREYFEKHYPADFIGEGLDQTRGWFYTLTVLAAALFDRPAAMHVIVNGLILAENGQKMSKRLKNYPDPMHIVGSYGADALRLFLLGSPVVRAEDLKFSEDGVREILRSVMLPIWNAYSFFVTYANAAKWTPAAGTPKAPENPANPFDRYILSSLADMVEEISEAMDNYQLQRAANRFVKFIEDLTNWYIHCNRRRFWDEDPEAFQTLYFCLVEFAKCAAPFIPFITETIYRGLRNESMPESVHLCDFPVPEKERRNLYLEKQMDSTRTAVFLGRSLRKQKSVKIRQPLGKAMFISPDPEIRQMLGETKAIIADELNVKEIQILESDADLVNLSAKANFKVLGKKLGARMKAMAALITKMTPAQISEVEKGGSVTLPLEGGDFALTAEDLIIVREEKAGVTAAAEGAVTLALDLTITPELENEGIAREFVSKVQNLRKEMDLQVSDRISVTFTADDKAAVALNAFGEYVKKEVLADALIRGEAAGEEYDLNGHNARIAIAKI